MTCTPCRTEQDRWYDTTPQGLYPGLSLITQASAAYDYTPRGVAERRRIRWERWRDTVRFQRDLIARTCREAGHAAAPSVRRIVTLDVLAVAT